MFASGGKLPPPVHDYHHLVRTPHLPFSAVKEHAFMLAGQRTIVQNGGKCRVFFRLSSESTRQRQHSFAGRLFTNICPPSLLLFLPPPRLKEVEKLSFSFELQSMWTWGDDQANTRGGRFWMTYLCRARGFHVVKLIKFFELMKLPVQ